MPYRPQQRLTDSADQYQITIGFRDKHDKSSHNILLNIIHEPTNKTCGICETYNASSKKKEYDHLKSSQSVRNSKMDKMDKMDK